MIKSESCSLLILNVTLSFSSFEDNAFELIIFSNKNTFIEKMNLKNITFIKNVWNFQSYSQKIEQNQGFILISNLFYKNLDALIVFLFDKLELNLLTFSQINLFIRIKAK